MLPTQMLCFQLSSDFDSLSKVASVWLSSLNNIESEAVADLCHKVKNNVTSVGTQLQLLLQVRLVYVYGGCIQSSLFTLVISFM